MLLYLQTKFYNITYESGTLVHSQIRINVKTETPDGTHRYSKGCQPGERQTVFSKESRKRDGHFGTDRRSNRLCTHLNVVTITVVYVPYTKISLKS